MSTPYVVSGVTTDSTGTPVAANVQIMLSWDAWLADNSAEIVQSRRISIAAAANGTWSTTLWANVDLTPANSFYYVRQNLDGNWDPPFTIVVPHGGGTIASMVTSSPALPAQYVTGPTGPAGGRPVIGYGG